MADRIDRKDFRRVRKERGGGDDHPKFDANDVHVTASRSQRVYISYAIGALTGEGGEEGRSKQDLVNIRGMGAAVYNAVNIAEIVKRRVKGLHQITDIGSQVLVDEYEHKEDKKTVQRERKVSTITITLSTKPLDKSHLGYQEPLPDDQVTEQEDRPRRPRRDDDDGPRGGRGRGPRGGRGGRGREDRGPRDRDDRGPRGGRGGRDDRGPRGGRDDRGPRGGRDDRAPRGGRGGRDDRDDRRPRGGRDDRAPRGGRDDRGPRGGRDDRGPRGGRDDRAPRGGRGGRDDRAPRGGRGGRDDRAPRGGYGRR